MGWRATQGRGGPFMPDTSYSRGGGRFAIRRVRRQAQFQPYRQRPPLEGGRCIFLLGRRPAGGKLSDTASEPEEIRIAWRRERMR